MDFEPYLFAWRQRSERKRERDAVESARALLIARRLAALLVERYGATRVVLVGSLARGDFELGSDIDLAVSGVAPDLFFAAGAALERAAMGLRVDLVPLESANPFFLDAASREGVCLA